MEKEASAAGSFIAGGERGSWQQAHTSTSTTDVEVVRQQQWSLTGGATVGLNRPTHCSLWARPNLLNQCFAFIQTCSDLQNTNLVFTCSNNTQPFHGARLEYYEQLSQLVLLQILEQIAI
jgi:hypothetical protein